MTAAAPMSPACWVCADDPVVCRCPLFGPEFHVVDSDVGPQYLLPLDPSDE